MIKFFSEISSKDKISCGGKGASLGEMTKAGFPVPNGFVLTTEAFGKEKELWSKEVLKAFDDLKSPFVAVRSSGTKEDGDVDSFAGQFESYLFVGKEDLIEKILQCHHSVHSPRMQAYCHGKGITHDEIKVAVVIQKMVDSEVAGVCFTVNPVSHQEDEIIIEAGYGLGEAVVSGMITPDNYIISKQTGALKKTLSQQRKKLILAPEQGGIQEVLIEDALQGQQKLNDEQIGTLAKLAEQVESHYGKPMDIEWALEGGKLNLLQARPITTFVSLEESVFDIFSSKISINTLYPPVTTSSIFVQTCTSLYKPYVDKYFLDDHSMEVLTLHQNGKTWTYIDAKKFPYLSQEMCSSFFQSFDFYKEQIAIIYEKSSFSYLTNLTDQELFKIMKDVIELYLHLDAMSLFVLAVDEKFLNNFCFTSLKGYGLSGDFYHYALNPPIVSFDKKQYLDFLKCSLAGLTEDQICESLQYMGTSYTKYLYVDQIKPFLLDKYQNLLIPYSQATSYLDKYYQELQLRKENYQKWFEQLSETEQYLASFIFTAIECRDERKIPIQKTFCTLSRCLELFFIRNNIDLKFLRNVTFDEILKGENYLLSIKDRLVQRECGSVFWADYDSMKLHIVENSLDFESTFQKVQSLYSVGENLEFFSGIPASPGKLIGKAKVIQFLDEVSCILDGEILITGMTRPEYVPLMKKAAGIITDEGGVTCHAAIVSRELKKPCIIGTKIATQVLKDGDLIELDAFTGVVRIIES